MAMVSVDDSSSLPKSVNLVGNSAAAWHCSTGWPKKAGPVHICARINALTKSNSFWHTSAAAYCQILHWMTLIHIH